MQRIKGVFVITSILFTISAISPLLIPFSVGDNGMINKAGYVAGSMFWIGLVPGIIGYILMIVLWNKSGKRIRRKGKQKVLAALRFFSNPPAVIADCILITGIAGVIYGIVDFSANIYVVAIALAMMLAGVYGHFLLNIDIFQYIWIKKKMLKKRKEEENEENEH